MESRTTKILFWKAHKDKVMQAFKINKKLKNNIKLSIIKESKWGAPASNLYIIYLVWAINHVPALIAL